MGESIFYSVRTDAVSPPSRSAWFTIRDLDNDEYRAKPNPQAERFIKAAREIGADEDAFKKKLERIAKAKPKGEPRNQE